MKRCKVYLYVLLIALLLPSCLDEITLLPPEGRPSDTLLIQAKLSKGDFTEIEVLVEVLFEFVATNVLRKEVGATVHLLHVESGSEYLVRQSSPGLYTGRFPLAEAPIPIVVGDHYVLEIVTQDGRRYRSEPEVLTGGVQAESVSVETTTIRRANGIGQLTDVPALEYSITTPLDPNSPRMRWVLEDSYQVTDIPPDPQVEPKICYITYPSRNTNVQVFDASDTDGSRLDNFPIYTSTINYRHAQQYYLTVYQEPLSEGAYTYWEQIKTITEREGNALEATGGRVITNLSRVDDAEELVVGYFYATEPDTLHQRVTPEFAGTPTPLCPPPPVMRPPDPEPGPCDNCLILEGSSLIRPAFWQ